jgi:hypothetical protein
MAYTQTDLDNIRKLIAAGAGAVSIAGKRVEYRSLAELRDIEARIEADVDGELAPRNVTVRSTKGW